VEDVLEQHSAVLDAAVVGVPDPVRDQSVKADVIMREQATATAGELIAWCLACLSPFKVTMGDDGPGLCPLCLERYIDGRERGAKTGITGRLPLWSSRRQEINQPDSRVSDRGQRTIARTVGSAGGATRLDPCTT
jgi:acyl-CoA synthetase (AMP-forming)/AMP-acid ligase II